jgi:hypothetical protein
MVDVLNMGINSTGEDTLAQCFFFPLCNKKHVVNNIIEAKKWSKSFFAP